MAKFLVRNGAGLDSKEHTGHRNKRILEMYLGNRSNKTVMEWVECKLHEDRDYFVYYYILRIVPLQVINSQ